ncbi:MAG TPA: PhoH family protein, partial [Elusimicrobiota bacterium]|nr:PhoH family protein [Elusimicrobiota bacterium]
MVTRRLALADQEEAILLFGQHDKNLRELERRFAVQIFVRPSERANEAGLTLAVRGRPKPVDQALATLEEMRRTAVRSKQKGTRVESVEVPLPGLPPNKYPPDSVYVTVTGAAIRPQTPSQQAYVKAIRDNDMVFGVGPAGTGKTYLAVACAIAALESGRVNRIVLTRPVVEAGEKLGFLPGDFYEKVHPYLKPLYDAFHNMVGADRFRQLREDETIEIIPLAYMRGRTLDEAFAILDEAQNTTPEQMKMFLTRMGNGSRMVITGDVTQIDLDKKLTSGLVQIQDVLRGVEGIDFVRFSEVDVVRHPLVKKIIRAFDAWDERGRTPPPGSP